MCGRVTLTLDGETIQTLLKDVFKVSNPISFDHLPDYNIGPMRNMLSVISGKHGNRGGWLQWGFVPPWSENEQMGYSLINARSESIDQKKTFKASFSNKRCLIFADSFYEWDRKGKEKVPYRFQVKNQRLFPMAGLYTTYTRQDGTKLFTCTVITTDANELMANIHHRMPVIFQPDDALTWLDQGTDSAQLKHLLKPMDPNHMSVYEVSDFVNNVNHNSSRCIEPVSHHQQSIFESF